MPEKCEIKLIFDSAAEARAWFATWISGGGEQGMGWHTNIEQSEDWTTKSPPRYLKLEKDHD